MKSLPAVWLSTVLSALIVNSASATIIDTFTSSATSTLANPDTGFRPNAVGGNFTGPVVSALFLNRSVNDAAAGGAFGGRRDGSLTYTAGSGFINAFVPEVAQNTLNIAASVTDSGTVRLEYDANGNFQGIGGAGKNLNLNVTGDSHVVIDVLAFNPALGNGETVTMFLEDNLGATGSVVAPIAVGQVFLNLFDPAFAGLNKADIDRIVFSFQVSQGTDLQIDMISTQALPEPGSIAVWSLCIAAVVAGGWMIRRQR